MLIGVSTSKHVYNNNTLISHSHHFEMAPVGRELEVPIIGMQRLIVVFNVEFSYYKNVHEYLSYVRLYTVKFIYK